MSLQVCPGCGGLLHAGALKGLAAEAERLAAMGNYAGALERWREALHLLPPQSRQFQVIRQKMDDLVRLTESRLAPPAAADSNAASRAGESAIAKPSKGAKGGILAVLAALLLKFKFAILALLGKAKLLLLGLTKLGTLSTMLASFGLYWTAWGWKFAVGLVVSIYIHEMGHVAALRRLGINASAPMFIPGLGAVILMKQQFLSPREDARVGLAGPIWGLGTAVAALAVFLITGQPIWGAIAHVGAWINLFNLLPVWQLDGSRGFHSLTRTHRWIVAAAVAAMWFATAEGLLFLILILTVVRALEKKPAQEPDSTALAQFVFLVITLSALCMIKVPMN